MGPSLAQLDLARVLGASRAQARDDRLSALFKAHAAFVARTLRRLGVPDSDVDDALQDVFLIAQRKLASVAPDKEQPYLFGIARRRASTVRRTLSRAHRRGEVHASDENHEYPIHFSEKIEEPQIRAMLDELLATLSFDLRTVLVLYELEGMSLREIAELTVLPLGTVATRLRRAREQLAKAAEPMRDLLTPRKDQET